MSSLIRGTHHISLKLQNEAVFRKAVHFYQDLLGLEPVRTWGRGDGAGIMLSTGNSLMEITATGASATTTGSINHFALATADVDTCIEAVRREGYPVTVEPVDGQLPTTPPYRVRVAFCVGPAGEEIEFFCEK